MNASPIKALLAVLALLVPLAFSAPTKAQVSAGAPEAPVVPSPESREREAQAAWQAAAAASIAGPTTVKLRDQAELSVPKGSVFIPQAEAARLSRALGNRPGSNFLGMVTTLDDSQWIVFITWTPDGYVRDDEAADLDAAALLDRLRQGTEEANADRVARGFDALEVTDWMEPPRYDKERHQLAWSLGVRTRGSSDPDESVNFNTRALGREGYLSLNLVTGRDTIAQDRSVADTLLDGLRYEPGKRYADFNDATDKVAEYGLLALIGAVAAKKLGLLALVAVFAVKFAKVGLLGVAGVGYAIKRFFTRRPGA